MGSGTLHIELGTWQTSPAGFTERVPRACPACGNLDIAPLGRGTEQIEEHIIERLAGVLRPDGTPAQVARMDADSTRLKGSLEQHLARMHSGEVDVLVGTQMVAKGHDFRRITLVAADYPAYFTALTEMDVIAADDAHNDPCTCGFSAGYLTPLGIGAMMDVPVLLGNQVDHLLCCEHIGPARRWTADEKTFAVAIANLISLSLEICGRSLARQEVLTSHQRFQSVASATKPAGRVQVGDAVWQDELPRSAARLAPREQQFSFLGIFMHAAIAVTVGDVHVAARQHCHVGHAMKRPARAPHR